MKSAREPAVKHQDVNGDTIREIPGANLADAKVSELRSSLVAVVERRDFPCVGAKSALAQGSLGNETAGLITGGADDQRFHDGLEQWSEACSAAPRGFRSLAVVFSGPGALTQKAFEVALWDRLGSLIAKDGGRGNEYDPTVSNDPSDPHFALSFGGKPYFAVGLHTHASRKARRTPYPTIVFNLHDQFDRLRKEQRYERLSEVILAQDEAYDGKPNPMGHAPRRCKRSAAI